MTTEPLPPDRLRVACDPGSLDFETTADLSEVGGWVGQERAVEAIELGLEVRHEGYNLFVHGQPGTGRHSAVRDFLAKRASGEKVPSDWCYVHDFDQPRRPRALRLPPGRGRELHTDMQGLVRELRETLPAVFESDAYRTRRKAIEQEIQKRQEDPLEEIAQGARERGVALIRTPMGFGLAAIRDGEVLSPGEVAKLPDDEKKRLEAEMEKVHDEVHRVLEKVPRWQREGRERIQHLDRAAVRKVVDDFMNELRARYADVGGVVAFLDRVEEDILENASDFMQAAKSDETPWLPGMGPEERFRRYGVNVLVDRTDGDGAPVVHEEHPTLSNLIGRIEHRAQLGALTTDYGLIQAGALHRANGGYVILDARDLLMQPFSYAQLKRVLRSGELRIDSPMEALGLPSTVTLEPEPIPFDAKVVLVGERMVFYLLCSADPDFRDLFKVAADFEERIDRDPHSTGLYARLLGTIARRRGLRPFDREAIAELVDHAARLAEDSSKLSTEMRTLLEIMMEAEHHVGREGRDVVGVAGVRAALESRRRRTGRLRERSLEALREGVVRVETEGERVGAVNGLSVVSFADVRFGRPTRITARAGLGKGELVDIEREVELGGPIHSKGVLIMQGYLMGQYGGLSPMALKASLVFEQSYGGVEGDSASLAEVCALLSAVAELPVRQGLAVTGSIDQHGAVQAVGGLNDKIEGFFDACMQAGELSGSQGVLLPASNVRHLMLRQDVVDAARDGKFHVYPVHTVDEAIELLTGTPAGGRDEQGQFPESSVHGQVAARLDRWLERTRELQPGGPGKT